MPPIAPPAEPTVVQRVFEAWSVRIPLSFAETFIEGDTHWHAHDEHRSVSLTSLLVTDSAGRSARS